MIRTIAFLAAVASSAMFHAEISSASSLPEFGAILIDNLPTARDLENDVREVRANYVRMRKNPNSSEYRRVCKSQSPSSCVPIPATAVNVARESASCGTAGYRFGWLPPSEVRGGPSHVEQLRKLAEARSVFSCEQSKCLTVARLRAADSREGLGVCLVPQLGSSFGPPSHCEPLYTRTEKGELILVLAGQDMFLCSMGMRDFDLTYWSRSKIDRSKVENQIVSGLSGSPFNLMAIRESESVVGSRTHLPSEVLSPFREWVTVRVSVLSQTHQNMHELGLSFATTILVNRQNTGARADWSAASEPQERAYLDSLRSKLMQKTSAICESGKWIDQKNYNCDLSQNFRPPRF